MRTVLAVLLLLPFAAHAVDVTRTVNDASGKPVTGATVWLTQDRQPRHTETDANGRFMFSNVAAKPADIVARKEGLALGGLVLPVAGTAALTIQLCEPDALRLRIKNQAYEPLPGAFLRNLFVADAFNVAVEDLENDGFPRIRSDASGQLTIPDLPKGTHARFVVGHRDYADAMVAYLPVSGKEQTILLYPGVKLRGRVTLENNGGAVARACVTVYKIGTGAQREAAQALTDSEGFYHVTVAPGEYFVGVRHPNHASPKTHFIAVGDDENVADLAMQQPRVIEGALVYADGKPCPGVPVSYWIDNDLYEQTLSQADGKFRLQPPPVGGRIHVVPPAGYRTENFGDIAVTGELQARTTLSPIKLVPLPVIEGTVLNAEGTAEPNVLIASSNLTPPIWVITGADGRFRVQLPQAPSQPKAAFRAEHPLRFLRREFEAPLEAPAPVTVALEPFEPDLAQREVPKGQNDLTAMVGAQAPEIVCDAWFNSSPLSLASLRNKVVVLAFWGAFDTRGLVRDCIEELRALHDLYKEAGDVAIVLIHDGGSEPKEVEQSTKDFQIPFAVGRDAEPFKTYGAYGIHSIPQIVLIDKHGVLRYFQTDGRILELIKSLRREA